MRHLKPWYLSAGVWGAAVSVGASAAALLPGTLPETRDNSAHVAAPAAAAAGTPAAGRPLPLAALLGGAAALYGRVRATRRVALAAPRLGPALAAQNWRMNAAIPLALALTPLLLAQVTGCGAAAGALSSPPAAYVAADRATFDAVAPEYAAYVRSDPAFNDAERARRERTLATWRLRVEAGERSRGRVQNHASDE